MNRGSVVCLNRVVAAVNRFNEAPIHESGKLIRPIHWSLAARGFNEAPIHESGKCSEDRSGLACQERASMRPRFMNRGSFADVVQDLIPDELQ